MSKFIEADRHQYSLLPAAIDDWLPQNHLARFVVEAVEMLDLSAIYAHYGDRGGRAYGPKLMVSLLFYGYATGVFSSRKLEAASYDSVAFRYVCGNHHPDHDTIANFRKQFLAELEGLFVQILLMARELGFGHVGQVNIDGTKIQANASKHSAMSYEHLQKLEAQYQAEVARLLSLAEAEDQSAQELDIPAEIAWRACARPGRYSKRAPRPIMRPSRQNTRPRWLPAKRRKNKVEKSPEGRPQSRPLKRWTPSPSTTSPIRSRAS